MLLNEWDPIGILGPGEGTDDAGPVDEYDCLRDPLISRLLRGDGREESNRSPAWTTRSGWRSIAMSTAACQASYTSHSR